MFDGDIRRYHLRLQEIIEMIVGFYSTNAETIWSVIVGIIVGGLITWFVAWIYYKRAGNELRQEANELRKLHEITLKVLEDKLWAELVRDASGKVSGNIRQKNLSAEYRIAVPEKDTSA